MPDPTPNPTPNPSPNPNPNPAGGGNPAPTPSALSSGAAPGANDWIPEKYRVVRADQSLDVEASARKLAGGYTELNSRLVKDGAPPETVDGYKIEGELPGGLKFDELKADPIFAARLKGFHAKGISNGQLQEVLSAFGEYVAGDREFASEECTTQLRTSWKTAQEYEANMGASYRAANALAGKLGLTFKDVEVAGLGNNPLFCRMMALVGAEIREDTPALNGGNLGQGSFDDQVAAIDKELEGMTLHDPKRNALLDKKLKLFEARVGTKRAPLVSG